jgi:hypothetical protein
MFAGLLETWAPKRTGLLNTGPCFGFGDAHKSPPVTPRIWPEQQAGLGLGRREGFNIPGSLPQPVSCPQNYVHLWQYRLGFRTWSSAGFGELQYLFITQICNYRAGTRGGPARVREGVRAGLLCICSHRGAPPVGNWNPGPVPHSLAALLGKTVLIFLQREEHNQVLHAEEVEILVC